MSGSSSLARLDFDLALGVDGLPRLLQLEVGRGDGGGAIVQLAGQRERPSVKLKFSVRDCIKHPSAT